MATYKIKLPVFEGPFDLLLFLIKKNEIDIYDIPIAEITREYLAYIELMQILDLEVAGEFIEMVATLILIKTRMLLPKSDAETAEEVEDPRLLLTLQLLEYKRFKEASEHLQVREEKRRHYFPRSTRYLRQKFARTAAEDELELEIDATLFDLLTAFKQAMDNMPKITVHQVKTIKITLEDQVRLLIERVSGKNHLLFSELVRDFTEKIYLIVMFMALLDLMKFNLISIKQTQVFGEIRITPRGGLSMENYLRLREELEVELEEEQEGP